MDKLFAKKIYSYKGLTLFIFILSIFISIGGYLFIQNHWIVESLPLGRIIPSVSIQTLDDKNVNIRSLVIHKSIIVFFSTGCPHCKSAIVILDSLHQVFKYVINIIPVSLSSKRETQNFVNDLQISLPTYYAQTQDAKRYFRVKVVPSILFINERKQLIKYQIGEQGRELLNSMILKFASISNDSIFNSL